MIIFELYMLMTLICWLVYVVFIFHTHQEDRYGPFRLFSYALVWPLVFGAAIIDMIKRIKHE